MNLTTYLSTLKTKGNLRYEYNPFHNYQTNENLYEVNTDVGKIIVPEGKIVEKSTGKILTRKGSYWVDKKGNIIRIIYTYKEDDSNTLDNEAGWYIDNQKISENIPSFLPTQELENGQESYDTNNIIQPQPTDLYATAGSLIDFTTDQLNFDLEHPVDIEAQPSYDGSVNLIINDDKNIPRLINSRFSVREKNTYEIVDRIGENDTNIYSQKDFDKDTSLYFRYSTSPKISFIRHINGTLGVGQYCYYFVYCDSDDNESDIIAESGLIPVFIGNDGDPFSMDGGIKNQDSNKGIALELSRLDSSYNYIKVYQFRYFADYQQNRVYECKKLYHKYPIKHQKTLYLNITGNEDGEMIDPNILNLSLFNPNHVLTQAQCKNMLFFGNIVKNTDDYRELTDCALRIVPQVKEIKLFDVNSKYHSINNGQGYYSTNNIYNYVGYFPNEYYRFGVVFIYSNGTLSNVYNTLGYRFNEINNIPLYKKDTLYSKDDISSRIYVKYDDNNWIDKDENIFDKLASYMNSKGVVKLDRYNSDNNTILGIQFKVNEEVVEHLKKNLNIVGMFFVRQKRIPSVITQLYLFPMDAELQAPTIPSVNGYKVEAFLDKKDKLNQDYNSRLQSTVVPSTKSYAGICPDFLLNQPYYNQVFNGGSFKLEQITSNTRLYQELKTSNGESSDRNYYMNLDSSNTVTQKSQGSKQEVKICTVTEDVPTVAIKDQIYRLNIGEAEQAWRFRFIGVDNSSNDNQSALQEKSTNMARGIYSPYLAIYSDSPLNTGCLYNVYTEKEQNIKQEFEDRMNSREPFYAIGDRDNFENILASDGYYTRTCYRGDCYNNTFTYRLNRNFNDPSLPNNDKIIKEDTWDENYYKNTTPNPESWTKISRADVNAVKLGSWITIKCKSSMNYALRSTDSSYVSETALMGSERSFYPKSSLKEAGENKKPDSYLYNDAYRATLGYKCYFTLNDVNYIKDTFANRIQYSAISIQDSYKNNFRYSLSTYFRDYSQEYGSIQKLVGFEGYLLVVFEHAICIAVINERVLAGTSDGEPVFINTNNVLPEELTVISDTYGTMWPESVVKSEAGYVYGVDTIAKKIWRVKGQQIEILSDFKVNNFLVNNITLGERETTPTIGLRNVKTHYNNNKKDVMFTFYDDIYKDEEKVWNLCYNELLGEFITFYSWVPSYSANIDTQFFSFDRDTSKYLSLLRKNNANIEGNTGVLVDTPVLDDWNQSFHFSYKPENRRLHFEEGQDKLIREKYDEDPENIKIEGFRIEKDHWGFYKEVIEEMPQEEPLQEDPLNGGEIQQEEPTQEEQQEETEQEENKYKFTNNLFNEHPVVILEVTPYYKNNDIPVYLPTETVVLTTKGNIKKLKPDFYLHGESGIFDCEEQLYPTHWYGKFHPFEFEFVVNEKVGQQKIFNNLILISNKAEPESFHFEIEGDNYEFSSDKRAMYYRQEATKELYQNLGSNILYNRKYTDIQANKYTQEQYYRTMNSYTTKGKFNWDKSYPEQNKEGLVQQFKSTIFPLYYERVDTYDNIYHDYREMSGGNAYDFKNLSGSEILWNRRANQFNIATHIKNSPIDKYGRMRGNSFYKEGKWNIQIPSIIFMQKNEIPWYNGKPTIVVPPDSIPTDIDSQEITYNNLPNTYKNGNYNLRKLIEGTAWTYRKEARIRDKFMKVRIRYSGKNLAIIHSIITLFNISYS